MSDRRFDLVLFGATGFTGRLVAAYLAAAAPPGLRWALAGRNEDKLARVRDELSAAHPSLAAVPLVVADSADPRSLAAMAGDTQVVCTTVGPYLRYGLPLVEACAAAGTDYCDLTGEVPFMRRSIDAFDARARRSGARIVHACGYDSIPSDLGTLVLQEAMSAEGGPADRVTTIVGPSSGGVSGGTLASAMEVMAVAQDKRARRALADPYALDPEDDRGSADTWDDMSVRFHEAAGRWVAPFFMGPVNTRVVRRSHALMGRPWGDDFSYTEVMATGRGTLGRARGVAVTAGMGAFFGAVALRPTRALLQRFVLPAPGEGPSEAARESGYFHHLVVGVGSTGRGVVRVVGHKDPGYGGTAIMLGEAALTLATREAPGDPGVTTPAAALGLPLVDRLRTAGMTLEASPWPDHGVPSFSPDAGA